MTMVIRARSIKPKRRPASNAQERHGDEILLWCIAQRLAGRTSLAIAADIGESQEYVRTATIRVTKADIDGSAYWDAHPFPRNLMEPRP